MAAQNSLNYTYCCCVFSSTRCWLNAVNYSPNCSLPISVSLSFSYLFKIWKHEYKHECNTKQTSNWFKREKFCHTVPAITYRLYIRLINMPQQTLGELTWLPLSLSLFATKATAKTEIRWMRRSPDPPRLSLYRPFCACSQLEFVFES